MRYNLILFLFTLSIALWATEDKQQNERVRFLKGVQINPISFFENQNTKIHSVSFSLFDLDKKIEYAFPVFTYHNQSKDYNDYDFSIKKIIIEAHQRYFFTEKYSWYWSTFLRYGHYSEENIYKFDKDSFGLGLGIGFRYYFMKFFYWGAGITGGFNVYGRNITAEIPWIEMHTYKNYIFDVECLRFGWIF